MKVTPLNPQFIVGTLEAAEEARTQPSESEPHLRIVPSESSASAETPERPLDEQTQDALRRLSRFIQKQKKPNPKRDRAMQAYDRVAHALDDVSPRGLNIDEEA